LLFLLFIAFYFSKQSKARSGKEGQTKRKRQVRALLRSVARKAKAKRVHACMKPIRKLLKLFVSPCSSSIVKAWVTCSFFLKV